MVQKANFFGRRLRKLTFCLMRVDISSDIEAVDGLTQARRWQVLKLPR